MKKINKISKLIFISSIIIVTCFIFLRKELYVNINELPFDDGLFIAVAEGHFKGNSGHYLSTTGFNPLVKGIIYPWILALSAVIGLNPLVFVLAIYLVCVVFLSYFFSKNYLDYLFLLLILSLNIHFFTLEGSRITRELTYSVFILVFLISILISIETKYKNYFYLVTFISGIVLSVVQNIREERFWIWSIVIFSILLLLKNKWKLNIKKNLILIAILIIGYSSGNFAIKSVNSYFYGVFLTNTTLEGEFPKLMANLSSLIVDEKERDYVSISRKKRELAYSISPKFRLLSEYIEQDGNGWLKMGCEDVQICDDYTNGFFHVLLREAIVSTGKWENQVTAQNYMMEINKEIELACQSNSIKCRDKFPIASSLGIIKLDSYQLKKSLFFMKQYFLDSFSLNIKKSYYVPAYQPLETKFWERWSSIIKQIPTNQYEYENKYNHRIFYFNQILYYWKILQTIIIYLGSISFLALCINKKRLLKNYSNLKYMFYLKFITICYVIWFTRGLMLSLNSASNFIGIDGRFATPGTMFLFIGASISLSLIITSSTWVTKILSNKILQ